MVVPANLVAGLRIPARAVTDGSAEVEWAAVSMSTWVFRREPSLRLPLDRRSARSVRRYRRLAPWTPLVSLIVLAVCSVSFLADLSPTVDLGIRLASLAISLGWGFVLRRGMPAHTPSRHRSGELRVPGVPVAVAEEWVGLNPGVFATAEPEPRPHSPRFYGSWAAGLLVASFVLALVIGNDGRENSGLLLVLVPVLFVAAVVMAYKIQPRGRVG